MHTSHNPCWDAKNRDNLPDELELSFASIEHLFKNQDFVKPEVKVPTNSNGMTIVFDKLKNLIEAADIKEEDLQKVVGARGHYEDTEPVTNYSDDFITRWIIPNWKKILDTIKNNKGEE